MHPSGYLEPWALTFGIASHISAANHPRVSEAKSIWIILEVLLITVLQIRVAGGGGKKGFRMLISDLQTPEAGDSILGAANSATEGSREGIPLFLLVVSGIF